MATRTRITKATNGKRSTDRAIRVRVSDADRLSDDEMLTECTGTPRCDFPDECDPHRCRDEIQRLTAENQALRRAATFLGDLAEQLNRQLHAERRLNLPPLESPTNS
jgi:hypothetical protein